MMVAESVWLELPDREGCWEFRTRDGNIRRYDVFLKKDYPTRHQSAYFAKDDKSLQPCEWLRGRWRWVFDDFQGPLKIL